MMNKNMEAGWSSETSAQDETLHYATNQKSIDIRITMETSYLQIIFSMVMKLLPY
jgi:hypothetical protein